MDASMVSRELLERTQTNSDLLAVLATMLWDLSFYVFL